MYFFLQNSFKKNKKKSLSKADLLLFIIFFLSCTFINNSYASNTLQLFSPGNSIKIEIVNEEALKYKITFKDEPVVELSSLYFSIDSVDITEGVEEGKITRTNFKETYQWYGVHSQAVNNYNGLEISYKHIKSNTNYSLEIRAFNNGVAFRIIVPGVNESRVPDETTGFILPAGSTVWYHDLEGHYEGVYVKKDVSEIQAGEWAAPPLTYKLPKVGYASITEADLQNYAGMALQADGDNKFVLKLGHSHPPSYPYRLRYSEDDIERLSKPAAVKGTVTTPWRVVIIGANLNDVVNNDIVHNLNPAPDTKLFPKGIKTDWIKPGRAVWRYLDDGGDNSLANMKKFSKAAGELGFEHNILEGFWRRWSDEEIKELVDYSAQHNVGIWVWLHSKDLRSSFTSRAIFEKLNRLGVTGVKIDFFDHEAKETIDQYRRLLKETAENKLLVNFHGANKPTGESKTWPNELTREAVKGMESRRIPDKAAHEVIIPFTRFPAGHAEYTVMHFGDRRGNTTWAHQVASAAILSTPLLTYAANPFNILKNPCSDMIKSIPSVWDETIVLPPSEIGEAAVFARRSGSTWFLAVMNGSGKREIEVPLSFLKNGEYESVIIRDNIDNSAAVKIDNTTMKNTGTITMSLGEGGGLIARFTKKND